MKKFVKLVSFSMIFIILLSGCTHKQESAIEKSGQSFLENLFTTNQNGRWDTYQSSESSSQEAGTEAMEQYYSDLTAMCTEDGLTSIAANRLPFSYDELAQEFDCSMSPAEIILTSNENTVDFTVKLEVTKDGKTMGKVE